MTDSPAPLGSLESLFGDPKPAYTPTQAMLEANRCLYCHDAPCIAACPTAIDIPSFIRSIATGDVEGSAGTIFKSNILGMSCARVCPVEVLCVGRCVLNSMGTPPIQIGRLQRFSTDAAFTADWRFFESGRDTGKKVALVGAGPASLACAHRLRRFGHRVTLFERRASAGGLNVSAIAPYKLRSERALAEIDWILNRSGIDGIEIRTSVEIPRDLGWPALEQQFDALFLGVGLGEDKELDLPGKRLPGVRGALEFIAELKRSTPALLESMRGVAHAVVLGGGNTALDVVRELLGLKAAQRGELESVTLLYRGTEAVMPGYAHEWSAAKKAGARAVWQAQPLSFESGTDGRLQSIRCLKLDADKRPIAGTELLVPAQLALLGLGQASNGAQFAGLDGVRIQSGRILTDEHGATGRRGVYAGGDCRNGGEEVVNAVAEGRDAAEAIHAFLVSGGRHG